ncbi:putative invertase inhibitor [Syzygium oleosum]|uniref:putative invertase inhibitor n=1 Tax=Syzygium oleosum TaxID=219896 RepID=UPI0011D22C30|nr:putative invertase inhibitor [Syzygium oleosum]
MENSIAALFFTFLLFSNALAGPQTQQLIDQICRQTEDYGFCNKTFNQHISGGETDMQGLAQIALEQGLENDTNTLIFARQLTRQVTDKDLLDYIQNCISGYLEIMEPFQDGLKALSEHNYSALVARLRGTPQAHGSKCGAFAGGVPNPLSERNREMRILITMSLNAAYILSRGRV